MHRTPTETHRELGALRGTYHVRLSPRVILVVFGLFLSFVFALFLLVSPFVMSLRSESMRGFAIVIGVLKGGAFVWAFPFACWRLFGNRNDELRIYQNGFTYRRDKELFACLWSEVADRRGGVDLGGADTTAFVVRSDGRHMQFSDQMRGLDELDRCIDDAEYRRIAAAEREGGLTTG